MNPIVVQVIQFILSLSILIVLHEFGHFIPAKIFKTRVEKFYLFFDVKFSLFKKKIGDTEYGIGWLPLGGYVKISGMIDESMDTEQMAQEPQPWEFRSKPTWQRLIIMVGGVVVNFVLAAIIYIALAFSYGDDFLPTDQMRDGVWVLEKDLGAAIGIENGDKVISVDGEKIVDFRKVLLELINGERFTVERNGEILEKKIPVDFISKIIDKEDRANFLLPRMPCIIAEMSEDSANKDSGLLSEDEIVKVGSYKIAFYDEIKPVLEQYKGQAIDLDVIGKDGNKRTVAIKVTDSASIGFRPAFLSYSELAERGSIGLVHKDYTFLEAIPAGINKGVSTLGGYIKQMKKIFNPETGAYKGVGGFGTIAKIFPDTWDWPAFWGRTAFLSIILGFMNILPIPALDGGHVMFLNVRDDNRS